MFYTRRDFGRVALTGLSLCPLWGAKINSTVGGVRLGAGTGSFGVSAAPGTDPVDALVQACVQCGVGYVELVNSVMEPRVAGLVGGARGGSPPTTPEAQKARDEMKRWRISAPLDRFREVRKKFSDSGITLMSYVMTFADDFSDQEIDAVFWQAEALGVEFICTNRTKVHMGTRLAPFAEKHKVRPAFHNHADVQDPDEVATPESLQKLLDMSKRFMINLDIGWYHMGGNDPLPLIQQHHARISHLHIKDRNRAGVATEFGEGGTPIVQCLKLIKEKRYPIYCIIEREFKGTGTPIEETKKWMDHMRKALA